ncbi:hypothetical protein C8Q74DRAFT_1444207 [Fomes fomentarius]|nr:hypothetical protein C8Q74DRAFT_1444207 [Fomes fomentarius]
MPITYEQQLDFAKVFGESLFYGADCVLMIAVLHIQLTSQRLMPTHKFMLALADLMFILTTIHICLLLYETFTATIPPRILQTAVAVAQVELAIGDLVLIWRVWVVWNRSIRIVILPALALIAGLGVGLAWAAEAVPYNDLSRFLPVPSVILSIVNTSMCTALIVGRVAYLDYLANRYKLRSGSGRDHTYRSVILMLIESGAVLTCAHLISLTLARLKHPGLHVMLNILIPLSNIVPTAIIVLSHFKLALGDTMNETTGSMRFATRVEESTLAHGTLSVPMHKLNPTRSLGTGSATRVGASLDFPPDIEKQAHLSCVYVAR